MSYLDNNVITVDAILTKKGREKFAAGNFSISKFALADDEIDYGLYNTAHPSGSDYYASAIENLPLLEAVADETKVMKYKLITLPKGTTQIPLISVGFNNINLYGPKNGRPGESVIITPSTINGLNETLGYTATLYNTSYATIEVAQAIPGVIQPQTSVASTGTRTSSKTVIGKSFIVRATYLPPNTVTQVYESMLTIHGNETGGSTNILVTVSDIKVANEL